MVLFMKENEFHIGDKVLLKSGSTDIYTIFKSTVITIGKGRTPRVKGVLTITCDDERRYVNSDEIIHFDYLDII